MNSAPATKPAHVCYCSTCARVLQFGNRIGGLTHPLIYSILSPIPHERKCAHGNKEITTLRIIMGKLQQTPRWNGCIAIQRLYSSGLFSFPNFWIIEKEPPVGATSRSRFSQKKAKRPKTENPCYILTLLFMKYVSDKAERNPHEVIIVPEGGSFSDIVKLKGDKEIGDKINKIIDKFAEANEQISDFTIYQYIIRNFYQRKSRESFTLRDFLDNN